MPEIPTPTVDDLTSCVTVKLRVDADDVDAAVSTFLSEAPLAIGQFISDNAPIGVAVEVSDVRTSGLSFTTPGSA